MRVCTARCGMQRREGEVRSTTCEVLKYSSTQKSFMCNFTICRASNDISSSLSHTKPTSHHIAPYLPRRNHSESALRPCRFHHFISTNILLRALCPHSKTSINTRLVRTLGTFALMVARREEVWFAAGGLCAGEARERAETRALVEGFAWLRIGVLGAGGAHFGLGL